MHFALKRPYCAVFVSGKSECFKPYRKVMKKPSSEGWFRKAFALEANVPYRQGEENRFPLTFDFAPVSQGYGWLFPRNDHVNIGLYVERQGERIGRAALDSYIDSRYGERRERSRAVGQFLGLGGAAYIPMHGTRIVLAGDAAGFVDPLTGEGISGAIRSGQAAAAAVGAALVSGGELAQLLGREMDDLQKDLRVAERAAESFYGHQALGWRLLDIPLMPRLALRAYSDGLPLWTIAHAAHAARRLQSIFRT